MKKIIYSSIKKNSTINKLGPNKQQKLYIFCKGKLAIVSSEHVLVAKFDFKDLITSFPSKKARINM